MMKHRFSIIKSVRIKIDHNLLALPGTKLSDIKETASAISARMSRALEQNRQSKSKEQGR